MDVSSRTSRLLLIFIAIAVALTLFSILRMIDTVLQGSHLLYSDYWYMIDQFIKLDGSLNLQGVFEFNNEHLLVIPKLLYWLNFTLFNGSNISLGLMDIGIVCGQLSLLWLMAVDSRLHALVRIAVIALASTLLFSLSGTWNFANAMSGTAWLSANFFAIAAIFFRCAGYHSGAIFAACLATLSYGTGILAWPAVAVVGLVRRPIYDCWREWPYAVGFLVSAILVLSQGKGAGVSSATNLLLVPQLAASLLANTVAVFSGPIKDIVGWIPLVGVPVFMLWLGLWVRRARDAGWIALSAYGWGAIMLIAYGRYLHIDDFGVQGRYHSLAALTWLGFAVLIFLSVCAAKNGKRGDGENGFANGTGSDGSTMAKISTVVVAAIFFLVLSASLFSGRSEVDSFENRIGNQHLNEIALRLEVVDGTSFLIGGFLNVPFKSTNLVKTLGHYPFVESWDRDCGLLHERIDTSVDGRVAGTVLRKDARSHGDANAVAFEGKAPATTLINGTIRCILVANQDGKVVGLGTRWPHENSDSYRALAPKGEAQYSIYFIDMDILPIKARSDGAPRKAGRTFRLDDA